MVYTPISIRKWHNESYEQTRCPGLDFRWDKVDPATDFSMNRQVKTRGERDQDKLHYTGNRHLTLADIV